jgi:ATP-dependent RNA helicase DHX8/PRP22
MRVFDQGKDVRGFTPNKTLCIENDIEHRVLFARRTDTKLLLPATAPRHCRDLSRSMKHYLYVHLPAWKHKATIIEAVKANKVLLLIGTTGCGKTTLVPRFLDEHGFGPVAVAQPRRLAAISVARRVSQELSCRLGTRVGYAVRFDDCSDPEQTRIRYATSGVLLREAVRDPLFQRYGALVIDEVHERLVQTDVLIAIARRTLEQRRERSPASQDSFRLVLMSAAVDVDSFIRYFKEADIGSVAVYSVAGNLHPVDVLYTAQRCAEHLDATLNLVIQLHLHLEHVPGDILAFLTGQEEIELAVRLLPERLRRRGLSAAALYAVPLYATLPPAQQIAAIDQSRPATSGSTAPRKVIFATNVAETSLTIPGVRFVIDPGLSKQRMIIPALDADGLQVRPISQAQALQRAGRAGREAGGGICIRLYPETEWQNLEPYPTPEVCRCDLAGTMLQLYALGLTRPWTLPLLSQPSRSSYERALIQLHELEALDDRLQLDPVLGAQLAGLPLEPMEARMVLVAHAFHNPVLLARVVEIAAMLSVDAWVSGLMVVSPGEHRIDVQRQWQQHFVEHRAGDLVTAGRVLQQYLQQPSSQRRRWCSQHHVNERLLGAAANAYTQLIQLLQRGPIYTEPAPKLKTLAARIQNTLTSDLETSDSSMELVQRCICAGFFRQAARREGPRSYRVIRSGHRLVALHPTSVFSSAECPEWVIFRDFVCTSKAYLRGITACEPAWLQTCQSTILSTSADSVDRVSK